jgi:outer membrane protein OmpA-like peptidoglycan-associated protein
MGYILPKIVGMLTPGGTVPSAIPSSISSYLASAGNEQVSPLNMKVVSDKPRTNWLLPLIILLAGLAVLWWAFSRPANRAITNIGQTVAVAPSTIPSVENKVGEWVKGAADKTAAALAGLKPGFSAKDLTDALNQSVINFPTGSSEVPAESKAWLTTTAEQMKKLPSGSVIEIAGHTDNVGDEAANLQLSQERAASVRQFLIDQGVDANELTTTGYGSTKPIASNDSFEGRFKNRRIEFTVKAS